MPFDQREFNQPTRKEFSITMANTLIALNENFLMAIVANEELEKEANDLMAECGRKDETIAALSADKANFKQLNSALHRTNAALMREVHAHRRALADIRQRIVNGETLTVSLAEPIQSIESAEVIEETFNRR